MGNVADQRLILTLTRNLLLRIVLQPLAHLLEVLAELPDLVVIFGVHSKVKIAVLDILRRQLQPLNRIDHTCIDPYRQDARRQNQDQNHRNNNIRHQAFYLGNALLQPGYHKDAPLSAVGIEEIYLLDENLFLPVNIDSGIDILLRLPVGGKFREQPFRRLLSDVGPLFVPAHSQVCVLIRQFPVQALEIIPLLHLVRIFLGDARELFHGIPRDAAQKLNRVGKIAVVLALHAVGLLNRPDLNVLKTEQHQKRQRNRRKYDNTKRNNNLILKLHMVSPAKKVIACISTFYDLL